MNWKTWTGRVFVATLIALAGTPVSVVQAESVQKTLPRLAIDPGDQVVTIRKRWTTGVEFVGNIRLTAHQEDITGVLVLPSDLTGNTGQLTVARSNIELNPKIDLKKGIPTDIKIKIKNIAAPGVYSGIIELLEPGRPRHEALKIPLTVTAGETPKLLQQAGSKTLQMSLVNCSFANCNLASLLLPKGAFADKRILQFRNTGTLPVVVKRTAIVVRGKTGDQQLTTNELALSNPVPSLRGGQISELPLTIKRSEIAPDRYTGSLELDLEGGETVSIPVDFTVRSGPLLAAFTIIFGIGLGRLVKFMQERGGPQADALDAVNDLSADLQGLHEGDQALLGPQLNKIRESVYDERLDTIAADLQTIRDRMDTLVQARRIEALLHGRQDAEALQVLEMIESLRDHIDLKQDVSANYQAIVDAFLALQAVGRDAIPSVELAQMKRATTIVSAATSRFSARERRTPEAAWRRGMRLSLAFTSGISDEFRAEATFWVARPLLSLTLILMLATVGLETLYVKEGATFGAGGLFDYTGLLIWGLSADVAGRTLSNLRGSSLRRVNTKVSSSGRS